MTDNSYISRGLSDQSIFEMIGEYVKHHRLNINKSQKEIAKHSGISRSTLVQLENGEKVSLSTLVKVLRSIDQLHVLHIFKIEETLSPIAISNLEKQKRKRASKPSLSPKLKSSW